MMKKIILQILLIFLCAVNFTAQVENGIRDDWDRKIDEFGKLYSDDFEARLDNIFFELKINSGAILQLQIYRGADESFGEPYRFAATARAYLTGHGIAGNRIFASYCAPETSRRVLVWLLNDAAGLIECKSETLDFKDTTLFDSIYFSDGMFSCCAVDGYEEEKLRASLTAFAEKFQKIPDGQAYLFFYAGTNVYWEEIAAGKHRAIRKLDAPNTWLKMSRAAAKVFAENNFDRSKIVLKNGGYKDSYRSIEIYFVPPGGAIPRPKPDYFPKPTRRKRR